MATSAPQGTSSTSQPPSSSTTFNDASRAKLIHNASLGALIVCPIIILLPPRKLDLYTFALLAGTFVGGNQLSKEYTGMSMLQRLGNRMESISASSLPPKAQEMQIRLREEKARREGARLDGIEDTKRKGEALARKTEEERIRVEKEKSGKGLLKKVWMGEEGDDWKQKRDQKEKEALEEGKGYGVLIMDQIWEVWNWGKDKAEEVKEVDEKVVAEREAKK